MTLPSQPDLAAIHIVDDDEAFRDSLVMLLESRGYRANGHASASAFLATALEGRRVCALVDVRMPGMNGLELQQALASAGNTVPVILLTGHADVPMAVQAMKAGAIDFIEKPFETDALLAAIGRALDRTAENTPSDEVVRFNQRLPQLTEREREVLDLIVQGQPNKVIAYRLGISQRTVEIHRGRVMTKLNIVGAPNLVRIAMAAGLLSETASRRTKTP